MKQKIEEKKHNAVIIPMTHTSLAVISSQAEMQTVCAAKIVDHRPVKSVHLHRLSKKKNRA